MLTYEVDQILIVEPTDLSALLIEPGKDYCTLVTCTPYGINTHRLLVRGHRIDTVNASSVKVTADAIQVSETMVAIVIAVPMLLILVVVVMVTTGRKPASGTARRRRSRKLQKRIDQVLKRDTKASPPEKRKRK